MGQKRDEAFLEVEKKRQTEYLKGLHRLLKGFAEDFFEKRGGNFSNFPISIESFYIAYPIPKTKYTEIFVSLVSFGDNFKKPWNVLEIVPLDEIYITNRLTDLLRELFTFAQVECDVILIAFQYHFFGNVNGIAVDYYRSPNGLNPYLFDLYAELYKNRCKLREEFLKIYRRVRRRIRHTGKK